MSSIIILLTLIMIANGFYDHEEYGHNFDETPTIDDADLNDVGPPVVNKRKTEAVVFETYNECKNFGPSSVVQIIRQNYGSDAPLCCDTLFKPASNKIQIYTVLGEYKQVLMAVIKFQLVPKLQGNWLKQIGVGQVIAGDLVGAKVSKLKIYDVRQINAECSNEPGMTRTDYLYEEIVFETNANKFKCIGDITPGFSSFSPGLLFSKFIKGDYRETSAEPIEHSIDNSKAVAEDDDDDDDDEDDEDDDKDEEEEDDHDYNNDDDDYNNYDETVNSGNEDHDESLIEDPVPNKRSPSKLHSIDIKEIVGNKRPLMSRNKQRKGFLFPRYNFEESANAWKKYIK